MKIKDIFDYKKPTFWVIVASVVLFLIITAGVLCLLIGNGEDSENLDKNKTRQENSNSEEKHDYISEITEAATCVSEGTITFTCQKCGDSYTESIEPTGHSYTSEIASEGNCSEKSTVIYKCSVCGDTYTEEGELDPEIHSALISKISTAPTCTESGVKTIFCSGCGYSAEETIPAVGHSMSKVSCTATCTANGISEYRCSNCGMKKSETTPAFGHNFAPATCTAPSKCERCGLSQGKRLGHTVHGGTCRICGIYIPPKNVVKIEGTNQKIYLPHDDPKDDYGYVVIKDCTVDYSDPKGAIVNFVVNAENAKLPGEVLRSMYVLQIINDMTGEVVDNHSLLICNGDDPIMRESYQLHSPTYSMTTGLPEDYIPEGDYTLSFVEYDSVY